MYLAHFALRRRLAIALPLTLIWDVVRKREPSFAPFVLGET